MSDHQGDAEQAVAAEKNSRRTREMMDGPRASEKQIRYLTRLCRELGVKAIDPQPDSMEEMSEVIGLLVSRKEEHARQERITKVLSPERRAVRERRLAAAEARPVLGVGMVYMTGSAHP